jgi:hypothetical protein
MRFGVMSVLAAGVCVVSGADVAHSELCSFGRRAEVPLEMHDGFVGVRATVNSKPVILALSLRAGATFLWSQTASKLGLRLGGTNVFLEDEDENDDDTSTGNHVTLRRPSRVSISDKVRLEVGELRFPAMRLEVSDVESKAAKADGMLGVDVFDHFDVDFDINQMKLTFYEPTGDCSAPTSLLDGQFISVPFRIRDRFNQQPKFEVGIGGRIFSAALSTDGRTALVHRKAAVSLGLIAEGGDASAGPVMLPELSVGGVTLRRVQAWVSDERRADVTLGLPFMRKVRVWLSNSSHQLILGVPAK